MSKKTANLESDRQRLARTPKVPLRYRTAEGEEASGAVSDADTGNTTPPSHSSHGPSDLQLLLSKFTAIEKRLEQVERTSKVKKNSGSSIRPPHATPGPSHRPDNAQSDADRTIATGKSQKRPQHTVGSSSSDYSSDARTDVGSHSATLDRRSRQKKRSKRAAVSASSSSPGKPSASSDSDSSADYSTYDTPTTSFGSLVGSNVDPKLRKKILANKFVEMCDILPQYRPRKKQGLVMKRGRNDTTRLVEESDPHDLPFDQWLEAFDVYLSVYIEKATSTSDMLKLTRSLLTYKKEIRSMSKLDYDWAGYDRHYRTDRVGNPTSWATTRQDLLNHYSQATRNQGKGNNSFRSQKQTTFASSGNKQRSRSAGFTTKDGLTIPHGSCRAYHTKGDRCLSEPPCQYSHLCPKCGKKHPVFMDCQQWPASNNRGSPSKPSPSRSSYGGQQKK